VRELCEVLNAGSDIADGISSQDNPLVGSIGGANGYLLSSLVQCLDNIANGNWAKSGYAIAGHGLNRPAGLRTLIAAAAV
jgi:hypothetical protein